MTIVNFQVIKRQAHHAFTCEMCGKPNRKRTITVEKTVNPYNKNPDGTIRTPEEVADYARIEAIAQRDAFAKYPVCATCENAMSYRDLDSLKKRRTV